MGTSYETAVAELTQSTQDLIEIFQNEADLLAPKTYVQEELGKHVRTSSLMGPGIVYGGMSYTFEITDYDSFSEYSVEAINATATINEKIISIVVDEVDYTSNVTISVYRNGVHSEFTLPVGEQEVAKPSINSPLNNATETPLALTISTSAFATNPTEFDTHSSTDWQVATDASFTSKIIDVIADTVNLESYDASGLDTNTTYYIRVRHNGEHLGSSDWSDTVSFTTANTYIETPVITAPVDGATDIASTVTVTASAFNAIGTNDTHQATNWQVATDVGFSNIVYQSLNDTSRLTSITLSNEFTNTTYYVRAAYVGQSLGQSDYSAASSYTTAAVFGGSMKPAGGIGFGVGIYPDESDLTQIGLSPMVGTDDENSDNFGNYQHTNGSIMVFVPKFYFRVGHADAAQFSTYGANSVEIVGAETFATTADAVAAGWTLHRAFIDGGTEKHGFFIDKYDGTVINNALASIKGAHPVSLMTTSDYNPSWQYTGCAGKLHDSLVLARARGYGFNQMAFYHSGAIALLSLAHAQLATISTAAWFDSNGTINFPKGCNNGSLGDVNDTSVTFTAAFSAKPTAGSGVPFNKTTHNGQNNGISDINGSLYKPVLGMTSPGANDSDTAVISNNTIYLLKESVALADLTNGFNGANDAWGDATHLATLYDQATSPIEISASAASYWGNGSNAVISSDDLAGFLPKDDNAYSASGANQFGNDYMYRYNRANMFPIVGGYWSNAASAGVFYRDLDSYRTYGHAIYGARAVAYLA